MKYVVLAVLFSLAASYSSAALVLDQDYSPDNGSEYLPFTIGDHAQQWRYSVHQTFTVGTTGYLSAAELYLYTNSVTLEKPLVIELRTTDALERPTEVVLASSVFEHENVPHRDVILVGATERNFWRGPYLHVDFTPVFVSAGQVLSLSASTPGERGPYSWWSPYNSDPSLPPPPTYSGGKLWLDEDGIWEDRRWIETTWDVAFRTFVEPVPEPASGLMACLAMASLLGRRKSSQICEVQ